MYYRLDYEHPQDDDGGYYLVKDGVDFDGVPGWALGRRFIASLPNPITLPLIPVEGYTGEPPEMFDEYMCLMSERMVRAMLQAGVDNIDTYPAVLEDAKNGRRYDYRAVNIIGLIAAANLEESEWQNLDGKPVLDTHFHTLVVDQARAGGQLIFRLAESASTIVVHERVRAALDAADLNTLAYTKVTPLG